MKCPKCAAETSGSGRFCRSCGAPLAPAGEASQEGSVCPSCGTTVRLGAKFCARCAAPLGSAPSAPPVVAAITICVNCGAAGQAGTKFCKSCGKAMSSGVPAATPDMMPTAVIVTPVRPPSVPAPRPPQPPGMAEPARPIAAAPPAPVRLPVPPPRMEPPAAPRPVPNREQARPAPAAEAQRPGGSNRLLIITSVVVLALAAVGLTYWFVLRKPAAQNAPIVEAPAAAQPTASAPAEASPESVSPESQVPATNEAQQPTEATPAGTTPAGNSEAAGSGVPAPARVPKRAPAKPAGPAYAQAHANAEQALAAAQYLNPPESSALFWARKAKSLGDPGGAEIEQQVFARQMAGVGAARQSHNYDQARGLIFELAGYFPDHPELRQMQGEIQQEEQRYTQQQEQQRRQAELQAQTKRFPVQHRHGTGSTFCTGIITVTADGVARYDCSTADPQGRCEHVTFTPGSLKEVKVRSDGSLHVATRQSGNFDFFGSDSTMKDAATVLGTLVKR